MEASVATAAARGPASRSPSATARVPAHVHAVLFASTSVVLGVLWDISWHSSIGRDTFWSPPHLAIYLGGVVAGVACGWHVLHITLAGTAAERAASVSFWKFFRGSLGDWLCIWGAIAMLTSAPFDDWWHNAYGLDVKILSPPHAVLALGILAIQLGALLLVLALQNRGEAAAAGDARLRTLRGMFAYAAGLVLLNFGVLFTEHTFRALQHGVAFFRLTALAFPLVLVAAAVAGRLRWPATATAAVYTGFLLLLVWIFPLFPAEPRLAPIRFPLDRMTPPQFPLLLIVPALAIDLTLRAWGARPRGWALAALLGAAFVLPFLAAQWPFAEFLQSEHARNPLFGQHLRPYMVGPESYGARGEFFRPAAGQELALGLATALGVAALSARIGLACGAWMSRVRR